MLSRCFLLFSFLFCCQWSYAQPSEIPEHIYFGGMKLNLSKSLRNDLLNQVVTMTKNKTYYMAKVNRADSYFHIIERVFEEEGIPQDFKYLVIQESQLQSDVVSSSNAVGFWQFKKESAQEVGIRVDNHVDERKHIVESSRAAARYLKKNYLLTSNWIYALISYQAGYGGTKKYIESRYMGAAEMDLDSDTYWYAVKFLAHKLAYEDKVGYNKQPDLTILEYNKDTKGKSLSEIASITQMNEEKLLEYNKWLLKSNIPDDRDYTVLLPVSYLERDQVAARLGIDLNKKPSSAPQDDLQTKVTPAPLPAKNKNAAITLGIMLFTTNNGLEAVIAREGDNAAKLAFAGKISLEKFFRYNDMQKFEEVKAGQIYYLESKNNKGLVLYHTVKYGESLWEISQKYGIKLPQIIKKNRMEEGEALQEGRTLYLRNKRPDKEPLLFAEKTAAPPPASGGDNTVKPAIKDTVKISPVITNGTLPKAPAQNTPPIISTIPAENTQPKPSGISGVDMKDGKEQGKWTATVQTAKTEVLADSSYTYHLVGQGQTLYALSRYYSVKVDSLRQWNNLGNEGLKFSQKIIVAKNRNALKKNFDVYIVKNNQDLKSIASQFGVSPEKIIIWNDKKSNDVLPGELLKLKL